MDPATEQQFGVRYASLDDLLASSAIVSLQLPLTEATRGLIGEAELAKMPTGAFLATFSRRAARRSSPPPRYRERQTRRGGTYVPRTSAQEAIPSQELPRSSSPHTWPAGSRVAVERALQMAIANIARFLQGESPLYLIPMPST